MASQTYSVNIATAKQVATVITTSTPLAAALNPQRYYEVTVTSDTWVNQATIAPTAAAANGNIFVPAGKSVLINGGSGANLAFFATTAVGVAIVVEATLVR